MRQVCFLLLFSLTIKGYAQKPKQLLEWINTAHAENKNFYFEIPFEYRNNEIVIPVTIGSETYDYIFDTGGYNDITDDIQKKNNFTVLTTQSVGSSNGLKSKINMVRVDSLKIGELVFRNVAALQMNFDNTPTIKCTINGALIGAAIIKNYIWQIDFSRKKIIVTDQLARVPLLTNAVKVPVTYNKRLMPFIEAKLNGSGEKFMFDLGSATLFSLTEKTAVSHYSKNEAIAVDGIRSEGGNGVLVQMVKIFEADVLEIASIKFRHKPVVYAHTGVENIIGNPVIKNFIVTLNFKDDELYFTPIPGTELTEGWSSFGFGVEYKGEKFTVITLFKGLSADKAGLKTGDEIISVNGHQIDCKNYCDCVRTIATMLEENVRLVLEVGSGQTTRAITVTRDKVY